MGRNGIKHISIYFIYHLLLLFSYHQTSVLNIGELKKVALKKLTLHGNVIHTFKKTLAFMWISFNFLRIAAQIRRNTRCFVGF